jgi:DNA-directed RNA polymerase specialized sigma24 family protein
VSSEGSVSRWLEQLQAGDREVVQQLWERYFPRLVGLARARMRSVPRRSADEEDVALSAFDSFCRNAENGRFPQLHDRDDLWRLLVVITLRKASHLIRDEQRLKRGGDRRTGPVRDEICLEEILDREPTPAFAAQIAEECQRLLRLLNDRELEAVAVWKMEGFTVQEIAERLGYAPRSIKRKLRIVRELWNQEVAGE